MFVFLSKFLPLFVYPLGLASLLILLGVVLFSKKRLARAILILAFLTLWLGGNRWVSSSLARSLEWQYLPPAETPTAQVIVVLGGGTEPGLSPRPAAEVNSAGDRILHAARLYHQGAAPRLLLSGGNITWMGESPSTPATEMAEVMSWLNVPADALIIQNKSQNTYEDALYSAALLREQGIDEIILVTSAMHMPRSVALFEHQGLKVIPAPADYTITEQGWTGLMKPDIQSLLFNLMPSSSNLSLTTNVLKEYIGIFIYGIRGWL